MVRALWPFVASKTLSPFPPLDTLGGFCKHPLRCVFMLCSRKCGVFTVISRHWQGYLSCLKCSAPRCFDVACFFDGVIS